MPFPRRGHRRTIVALVAVATAGVVAGFAWMTVKRSDFGESAGAEACAALYQQARAAADTAAVDSVLPFRGSAGSCGWLREQGLVPTP